LLVAVLLAVSPGTPSSVAGDAILSNFRALDADRSWSHGGKAAVIPRVSSVAGEAGENRRKGVPPEGVRVRGVRVRGDRGRRNGAWQRSHARRRQQ
jgi:hypothetical protein